MKNNYSQLNRTLEDAPVERVEFLLDKINKSINPPTRLTKDDVYIRAMFIVNEEVNSYGGKFSFEELTRMQTLLVDAPVMVGHRKDKLPIARNFFAELITDNNRRWLKSYFYWLKNTENAEDLKENLDGGIYKECSIGFTYQVPECSICAKDIRTCRHEPFVEYMQGGRKQLCNYYYKNVDKVLETSLVYRGAVEDTSISNELSAIPLNNKEPLNIPEELETISHFKDDHYYLLAPHYEGVDVKIITEGNNCQMETYGGEKIPDTITNILFKHKSMKLNNRFGRLVGYRGKQRCRQLELKNYLDNKISPVSRVMLYIFPHEQLIKEKEIFSKNLSLKLLRTTVIKGKDIKTNISLIKTKDGIRIWDIDTIPPKTSGFIYKDNETDNTLTTAVDASGELQLHIDGEETSFRLKNYSHELFNQHRRFIAEKIEKNKTYQSGSKKQSVQSYPAKESQSFPDLDSDNIIIKPVILNGEQKFCCYKQKINP